MISEILRFGFRPAVFFLYFFFGSFGSAGTGGGAALPKNAWREPFSYFSSLHGSTLFVFFLDGFPHINRPGDERASAAQFTFGFFFFLELASHRGVMSIA